MIKEFIIKDVRCFAGENRLKIRPLTFLTGENSTGKSTTLGCLHALATSRHIPIREIKTDFNSEPYQMGSFSEIIRSVGRNTEEVFSLGFQTKNPEGKPIDIIYTYEELGSEPSLAKIEYKFSSGRKLVINLNDKGILTAPYSFSFNIKKENKNTVVINVDKNYIVLLLYRLNTLLDRNEDIGTKNDKKAIKQITQLRKFLEQENITDSLFRGITIAGEPISISPIRSKPKRTYDPIGESLSPEGDDVPMYLMRLKRTSAQELEGIQKSLSEFGKASGLFSDISVKAYGKGMNEPFQLQVKVRGTKSNFIDVGYGVSQILPILVRIFSDKKKSMSLFEQSEAEKMGSMFLLQQPEVHLHPRGQAELASLFISSIAERNQKFIIETHSDYMIDRARIEIRKKKISKDDVSLIYMEPKGNQVKVHNIGFDDNGNLLNVPPGYRQFFLNEADKFLGFDD